MTDIVERLRSASLQTDYGLDIDKELMDEGWREIERLRADGEALATKWQVTHAKLLAEFDKLRAEIERLRLTPEEAYLQIVEGWLRDNRGIHFPEGAVDDLCERISRRALELKP